MHMCYVKIIPSNNWKEKKNWNWFCAKKKTTETETKAIFAWFDLIIVCHKQGVIVDPQQNVKWVAAYSTNAQTRTKRTLNTHFIGDSGA